MVVQLYDAPVGAAHTPPRRFEHKYYLAPAKVGLAYGFLQHICLVDRDYPSEQVNSLYFDTADLDQHEMSSSGDFRKDKVRIRWYGDEENMPGMRTIFIELKSKKAFATIKRRRELQVSAESLTLDHLGGGVVPRMLLTETLAGFGYFPPGLLIPVIKISYWRYRFSEVMTGQRLSLDCHVRSTMIMPGPGNGEKELELPGGVIEIKGQSVELPAALKRARMLDTDWTRFSKYSTCIDSHTDAPGSVGRLSPSGRIVRV